MYSLAREIQRKLIRQLGRDFVMYEGARLPPRHIRFGGQHFQDNRDFLESARQEAQRLIDCCNLDLSSRILEIGCGPGRLSIDIIDKLGDVHEYVGLDVNTDAVSWCRRHISSYHPSFQFIHINVFNPRYNSAGDKKMDEGYQYPTLTPGFDVIYLYSVFSHLLENEIRRYCQQFAQWLGRDGTLFLTAFLEEDVPPVSENPDGYRRQWSGPLHCVRYNRDYFYRILSDYGLQPVQLDYGVETDGQSGLYVKHKSSN